MDLKQSTEKRFALLIDADNVSAKYIKPILDELSKYGTVTYKRIYGDWTLALHAKWKDALLENSITPIQQFGYTQGKNATDSAMIIDAMDILYTHSVDGFCIVSSDSDFTRLAARIRESGLMVVGMGEKKTPTPFRKACDIFTTLELLVGEQSGKGKSKGLHASSSSSGQATSKDEIEQAVVDIITDNQNNGKATGLGEVGSRLLKRYPDFDVRSYGTNLLSKLLGEFSRVKITKEGSSVAVELVDERGHEQEGARASQEGARTSKKGQDAPAPSTPASGADKLEDGEPDSRADFAVRVEPSLRTESSARAKKRTPRRRHEPALPVQATDQESSRVAKAAKPSEPEKARQPKRTEQPAKDARAQNDTQPAAKDTQPAKGARIARASRAPKDTQAQKDVQSPKNTQPAKALQAPKNTKAVKGAKPEESGKVSQTPQSLIRQAIVDAGSAGVSLSSLNKLVRSQFQNFKVRDLGYSQLKSYIAHFGDVEFEKIGKETFVRLGE